MKTKKQILELRKILIGIDKDELEDKRGWWETSTGVEFGKRKLEEAENLFSKALNEQRQEFYANELPKIEKKIREQQREEMIKKIKGKEKSNYWIDKEIKKLNAKEEKQQWGIRGRAYGCNEVLDDIIKKIKEL